MGGFTSLLLLLCIGFTLSAVLDLQRRIMRGHGCGRNERLYHVKLISKDGNKDFLCGGSLINESWILTAAHCWPQGRNMTAEVGVHPNGGRPVPVRRHEIVRGHDIMLLELINPTEINHFIRLPNCGPGEKPPAVPAFQIAGYGHLDLNVKSFPNNLQCANLPEVACYRPINHTNPDRYIFCGGAPGVSACPGDSGGGVVYNETIYGVIRGGNSNICNPISTFMNVCEYVDDIRRITGIP